MDRAGDELSKLTEKKKGEKGLELTELEWLIDHHITKEQERRQMIDDLDLKSGDSVLDLGCGPGLWAPIIAEKVKPHGKVTGIDFSRDLISYAKERAEEEPLRDIIEFQEANFYNIPFDDKTFDFVFFGNCFAYVTNHREIMDEMKRVTKLGGRIAGKDFDGAIIIFHPTDPELSLKVMAATAQGLKERPPDAYFDNYVGRKMHGFFLENGLMDVTTRSYAIQKVQPLAPEAKRYITGNAEWYASVGAPFLSENDLAQWRSYFDPNSENYILDSKDFYFCMLEVITVGRV